MKKQVIHKWLAGWSSVCGADTTNKTDSNNLWKKVTCIKCLKLRKVA